jgi:hypothetical protein
MGPVERRDELASPTPYFDLFIAQQLSQAFMPASMQQESQPTSDSANKAGPVSLSVLLHLQVKLVLLDL